MSENTKDVKSSKKSEVQNLEESSYPMHEFHAELWNSNDTMFDTSTPIARAWSRLVDRGMELGPPMYAEYKSLRGNIRQMFTYALAEYDDDEKKNPNKIVVFYDARGIVGTESGL